MLNDSRIRYFCDQHKLVVPFDDTQLQPHSIDLRLGTNFKVPVTPEKIIETGYGTPALIQNDHKGEFTDITVEDFFDLPALGFVLAHTQEYLNIPHNLVGFCAGKSTIARNGLQIEAAGLLDAGFCGQVTLELFNMSPWTLRLPVGLPICQAYFVNADEPTEKFYGRIGHYNGQTGAKEPVFKL